MDQLLATVIECQTQAIQGRKGLFCLLVSEVESVVTLSIPAVGIRGKGELLASQLTWKQSGRERQCCHSAAFSFSPFILTWISSS